MNSTPDYLVADDTAAGSGADRVAWARANMPILAAIRQRLETEQPFRDLKIGICLHVEAKSGVWIETLMAGGAKIAITGSPGSTQDDTAAFLVREHGVSVYAWRDENFDDHMRNARHVLSHAPDLVADNGGDLHYLLGQDEFAAQRAAIRGATEETTTGANRLREELPAFDFPTVIINDTMAKRIVENRYGVGISVVDGMMRSTNIMLGGKTVVVIGYGYCGQGVAQRLRGLGAHVIVVDKAPLAQLEAHLEGFRTGTIDAVLELADVIVTVTGRDVAIRGEHFDRMKDGVVLCNAGQNSSELSVTELRSRAQTQRRLRPQVDRLELDNGKTVFLLAHGNLINLAGGDGNPIEVMDLGLALQTLSLERLATDAGSLQAGPQTVPWDIEQATVKATLKEWVGS